MTPAWLLVAAAAAGTAPSDVFVPTSDRIAVFVGEQTAFERIDCVLLVKPSDTLDDWNEDGTPDDDVCGEDDLRVRARYRVVMPIEGVDEVEYEFLATGWTESWAPGRWAVLYLRQTEDGWIMPGGLGEAVWPTVDGGWGACNPYEHEEPVEFAGDLAFGRTDGMSAHGIRERFPAADFEVVGERVYCIRGETLPTVVQRLDGELDEARESGFGRIEPHATRP